MSNTFSKFRSNKYRYLVYPVAIAALGVFTWLGWFHEPAPALGQRLSSADMLARCGAFEKAEEELAFVFDAEPDNRHAWLIQGFVDEKQGQHEQAIMSYRAALKTTYEADLKRDIRFSIADLFRRAERFNDCKSELDAIEKDLGAHETIYRLRGLVAWCEKDYETSRSFFAKAKKLAPEAVELDVLAAGTLIDEERYADAKAALSKIPKEEKAAWPYWKNLARSLVEAGEDKSAKDALETYVQLDRHGKARLQKDEFFMEHKERLGLDQMLSD